MTRHISPTTPRKIRTQSWCKCLVLTGCLLLISCGTSYDGPPRGAVQGKITIAGEPLEYGAINFYPTEGTQGPTAGAEIKDGWYELPEARGPVVGRQRVEITGSKSTSKTTRISTGQEIPEMVPVVPSKYNTNSELVREIESGDNTLDFSL